MQETLDTSIIESAKQIILGFGGFMGLAILLGMTGDRLHALLRGRFGRGYDYLICPGTLCSAFARRLACFVTGVKARDYLVVGGNGATVGAFVPRTASTRGGFKSAVQVFVIETAPLWFGSAILILIAALTAGNGFLPDLSGMRGSEEVGVISYVTSVFFAALGMLVSMVTIWHWTSPSALICLYLFLCIATEMSFVRNERKGKYISILMGTLTIGVFLVVLNCIPGVSKGIGMLFRRLLPYVYLLHAIFLFVTFFNTAAYLVLKCLIGKKRGRK